MKKSLLVLPAVLLLLAACTPEAGGGGGNTSTSGGGGASGVKTAITLTAENLLGYNGTDKVAYHDKESIVIDGMTFGYVELTAQGDGIQWRNQVAGASGKASQLFNTTIGATETIESLVFNFKPEKYASYAPSGLEVMAGTTSQKDVATGAGTIFTTEVGVMSYTINLPVGTKYFKLFKAIAANGDNFGIYLNSIVVNTVKPAA